MTLRSRFEQLAERERKLLVIFLGLLGGFLVLLVPLLVSMSVSERRDQNDAYREAIDAIADERAVLAKRQEGDAKVVRRYASPAPPLAGMLADFADKSGVSIPETQDRAAVPHGKTIKERQTRIRLSKVGMLALSNFLEKIAQSPYPVRISHLDITKRGSKDDEFDAEIDVSAYDREEPKKPVKVVAPKAGQDEEESE